MPQCDLTGRSAVPKNLVSHSNIKIKSRACLNVQRKKIFSVALQEFSKLNVSTSVLRTLDHIGGLDTFLLRQSEDRLSAKALKLRGRIKRALRKTKS